MSREHEGYWNAQKLDVWGDVPEVFVFVNDFIYVFRVYLFVCVPCFYSTPRMNMKGVVSTVEQNNLFNVTDLYMCVTRLFFLIYRLRARCVGECARIFF